MDIEVKLEEYKDEKEKVKDEMEKKQEEIDNFELDHWDYEDSYTELLDEEGEVEVAGMSFRRSDILYNLDPTAYRCGLIDYTDTFEKEEDAKYQQLVEEHEILSDEYEDLEEACKDLENELLDKQKGGLNE